MQKVAHHHPRTYEIMEKAQEWVGKIMIAAALGGGLFVLFSALTSHGSAPW